MNVFSRLAKFSALSLSMIIFNQQISLAETFMHPQIEGKYIDSCINSYRFPEGCSQAAQTEVAKKYCIYKGYRNVKTWGSQDFGWENRTNNWKWTEKYVDGSVQANFYGNEGANRFTGIECS